MHSYWTLDIDQSVAAEESRTTRRGTLPPFPRLLVGWAALGPQPRIATQLAAWGRALALDGVSRVADVVEMSNQIALHLADKRMLLVVDNAWDDRDAIPFLVGEPARPSVYRKHGV